MVFLLTTSSRSIGTRAVSSGSERETEKSRGLPGDGSRTSLWGFRTTATLWRLLRQRTTRYGSRHLGMECSAFGTEFLPRSRFATAFQTLAYLASTATVPARSGHPDGRASAHGMGRVSFPTRP